MNIYFFISILRFRIIITIIIIFASLPIINKLLPQRVIISA